MDAAIVLNPSTSPEGRRLLESRQKDPSPLSESLDPDQASPNKKKKLLATKWSNAMNSPPPLPPLSRPAQSKDGRTEPSNNTRLDKEGKLALGLSMNQKQKEVQATGNAKRMGLAAKWEKEHLQSHPSLTVGAWQGRQGMTMREGGMFAHGTTDFNREETANKMMENLFFTS